MGMIRLSSIFLLGVALVNMASANPVPCTEADLREEMDDAVVSTFRECFKIDIERRTLNTNCFRTWHGLDPLDGQGWGYCRAEICAKTGECYSLRTTEPLVNPKNPDRIFVSSVRWPNRDDPMKCGFNGNGYRTSVVRLGSSEPAQPWVCLVYDRGVQK